jgi:hypothetical protein
LGTGGPFAPARIEHDGPRIPDDQIGRVVLSRLWFIDGKGPGVNRFHRLPVINHFRGRTVGVSLPNVAEHVFWFNNPLEAAYKTEAHHHRGDELS